MTAVTVDLGNGTHRLHPIAVDVIAAIVDLGGQIATPTLPHPTGSQLTRAGYLADLGNGTHRLTRLGWQIADHLDLTPRTTP